MDLMVMHITMAGAAHEHQAATEIGPHQVLNVWEKATSTFGNKYNNDNKYDNNDGNNNDNNNNNNNNNNNSVLIVCALYSKLCTETTIAAPQRAVDPSNSLKS